MIKFFLLSRKVSISRSPHRQIMTPRQVVIIPCNFAPIDGLKRKELHTKQWQFGHILSKTSNFEYLCPIRSNRPKKTRVVKGYIRPSDACNYKRPFDDCEIQKIWKFSKPFEPFPALIPNWWVNVTFLVSMLRRYHALIDITSHSEGFA